MHYFITIPRKSSKSCHSQCGAVGLKRPYGVKRRALEGQESTQNGTGNNGSSDKTFKLRPPGGRESYISAASLLSLALAGDTESETG